MASQKILFNKFNGLWSRDPVESCPPDHFTDTLNTRFNTGAVLSRKGVTAISALGAPARALRLYKTDNKVDAAGSPNYTRVLYLAGDYLYDAYRTLGLTAGVTGGWSLVEDFEIVSMFNRAFINIRQNGAAYPGSSVVVYNGIVPGHVSNYWAAASGAPVATTGMTASFIGGASKLFENLSQNGYYAWGIAYESATGFIIAPSNYFAVYGSLGLGTRTNINFNFNAGLGPAGTQARWIVVTKRLYGAAADTWASGLGIPTVPPYYVTTAVKPPFEFFFLKRIANNTDIVSNINYADDELSESAEYLFDQVEPYIRNGNQIGEFNGRLIIYGQREDPNTIHVSKSGEPESFSATSGFRVIDATDPSGVQNGVEYRGNLYVFTRNRTAVLQDNGDEVSTWDMQIVDKAIGTGHKGVAVLLDSKGAAAEGFMVASDRGIHLFNGAYQEPELTYKVENIWKRINKTYYYNIELVVDSINKIIYANIPLDASTTANYTLMGDYREGLDPKTIKWSLWLINSPHGISGGMVIFNNPDAAIASVGYQTFIATNNYIARFDPTVNTDVGANFASLFTLPPARFGDGLSHFNRMKLRVLGTGTLRFSPYTQDTLTFTQLIDQLLAVAPGREYAHLLNHVNEELRLYVVTIGEANYEVRLIQLEGDALWDERPR